MTQGRYEKMSEHYGNDDLKPGNACEDSLFLRITWDELCFKNPRFIAFIHAQIGRIPNEFDREFTLYQATLNGFEKDQRSLKGIFLGENKKYLSKIFLGAYGIQSLQAKFGQTENGKIEDYIEYKIRKDCIYHQNVLHEMLRARMYKVVWDFYVNFRYTARKCYSHLINEWVPVEEYDEKAEEEERSRRKQVAIEARKKYKAKSLMPPPPPKNPKKKT